MTLFNNKYRIESARHPGWDYRNAGAYFITICTKDRFCYFGECTDGEMVLNDAGRIVETEWLKTREIRQDMNLTLGEFVVMPNHFHGIVIVGENQYNIDSVETHCNASLQPVSSTQNQFGPQCKNLSFVIRGFKSAVTTQVRTIVPDFAWQPRFHDHIIRNRLEYERIENYILNNPANWTNDKFYLKS